MTSTVDPQLERRTAPVAAADVAVIGGAVLLWVVITAIGARLAGLSWWPASSWGRWDTGHYLGIADNGYIFEPCDGVANRGPDDYCGSSGWFPGFPYLMRFGSWFGPSTVHVGRAIAVFGLVTSFAALWFGFLRRRPQAQGLLAMALAASFPAGVYYGAIFPISTMTAMAVLALVCLDRQRWLLAGCCGALAALVYPSGILLGSLAVVPLLSPTVGDVASRVRASALVGGPVAVAYLAVLANFQRAVDHWDAWFKTTASYDLEPTLPWAMIARQLEHLGDDAIPGVIGVQTALVAMLVLLAGFAAVVHRRHLGLGERGAVVLCLLLWLVPLTLGGDLSLYRAESLLLPIVILVSLVRPAVIAAVVCVAVPVAIAMAELFFDATLI